MCGGPAPGHETLTTPSDRADLASIIHLTSKLLIPSLIRRQTFIYYCKWMWQCVRLPGPCNDFEKEMQKWDTKYCPCMVSKTELSRSTTGQFTSLTPGGHTVLVTATLAIWRSVSYVLVNGIFFSVMSLFFQVIASAEGVKLVTDLWLSCQQQDCDLQWWRDQAGDLWLPECHPGQSWQNQEFPPVSGELLGAFLGWNLNRWSRQ